jgi:putative membrane protein
MMMISEFRWAPMVAALVYAAIGLVIFGVAFVVVDRLTPYHLWKEIVDEKNAALAIVVGAMAIGISIIISAAIR